MLDPKTFSTRGKFVPHSIYLTLVGGDAKLKWAVAARSKRKAESTLKSIAKKLGNDRLLQVDVIIVDTS